MAKTTERFSALKILRTAILMAAAGLLLYHSVYFVKLDERRQAQLGQQFDPADYAARFWRHLQSETSQAVDAGDLMTLLATDLPTAVTRYGKTLGVSRSHSFLVQGSGKIITIADDALVVKLHRSSAEIVIVTDYLFGNDIRDASGLVRVSDFPSTMEFNSISAEINKIVTTEVLPQVKSAAVGMNVKFVGATTVNDEHPEFTPLRVVPIQLELSDRQILP